MSEELLQRDLINNPEKIGKWDFRNIGSTTLSALKNAGIIPKKDYKSFERRKPDGIISIPDVVKSKIKTVIGIIENKNVSKFKTDKQKQAAFQQGLEVAQILDAKILILTDTVDTIWINALNGEKILDEKGNAVKIKFDIKNPDLEIFIEKIVDSIDKDNSQIREPRLKDPTKLAKSVWQDLWMAAGATPENCLYSFVELFIFKYLSDLGILKGHLSYDNLMDIYKNSNDAEATLEYYAGTVRKEIKKLFKPSEKDNTTIINGTIFVSKDEDAVKGYGTVFIKILKKFNEEKEGGGELKNIDRDFKSKLFETFLKESISKKNWGQYFTPLKVVRAMGKMAQSEIKPNIIICDPACGVGKFLLEPLSDNLDDFFTVEQGKLKRNITLIGIDKGFDKEEQKTIILAKANMLIYLSDLIRKNAGITEQFSNLFNDAFELKTKNILGTLRDVNYKGKIDLILTNPPYVTTGSSNLKEEISKVDELKKFYKINAMGVEGLFMEWIIRSLKPNGKAFIVVPDGIFNRQNDKNLRQFILDECIIDGIISLPLKTFFTTQKKTYILCLTKKKNKTEKQTDPVFTYLVSEIGESRDIYRFPIEQDDLSEAVNWFNQFKNAKKTFKFKDKRCKTQPIEKFAPETHWNVERWWTKDEQIELGIIEEDKTAKFEELPDLIEEVANNILSFKEEVLQLNEKKKDDVTFKAIPIGDIFEFPSTNSKITKEFCNKHKGNIPVYASSKNEESVLGYIKDKLINIKYYENCLSWNRNGSVGYVFIRNHRFTTNEDHRVFVIKKEFQNYLSNEYLKFVIELNLFKNGFSFLNKCGLDKIQPIRIQIPINKNGIFDIEKQIELAKKYKYVSELKAKIENYKKQIEELNIIISDEYSYKKCLINSIFDFTRGRVISKKDLMDNAGEYPVYSSNTKENGVFGYLNSYDFDCEGITWTTDGIYAGTTFYRNGRFSITNVCGLMTIKEEYKNCLHLPFIREILNFRNIATGSDNKKVMTSVILNSNISIKIPITKKGEFDLSAQQQIEKKYRKIEQIKKSISDELDKISKIEIDYA